VILHSFTKATPITTSFSGKFMSLMAIAFHHAKIIFVHHASFSVYLSIQISIVFPIFNSKWPSNILPWSVHDEGYYRNTSRAPPSRRYLRFSCYYWIGTSADGLFICFIDNYVLFYFYQSCKYIRLMIKFVHATI
jgi:hypothetical protein